MTLQWRYWVGLQSSESLPTLGNLLPNSFNKDVVRWPLLFTGCCLESSVSHHMVLSTNVFMAWHMNELPEEGGSHKAFYVLFSEVTHYHLHHILLIRTGENHKVQCTHKRRWIKLHFCKGSLTKICRHSLKPPQVCSWYVNLIIVGYNSAHIAWKYIINSNFIH